MISPESVHRLPRLILRVKLRPRVQLVLKAKTRKGAAEFYEGIDKIGRISWRRVPRPAHKEIPPRPWHTDADRQLIAAATPKRHAATFEEARDAAKAFKGQPIVNNQTGIAAVVSNQCLDKMIQGKAVSKSETAAAHSHAVANLDALFERAKLGWSKPDDRLDRNIKAIHRFFAPLAYRGRIHGVKLTVKETTEDNQQNPLYTVESVEFGKKSPAAQWTHEAATRDGVDPRYARSAGDIFRLAQRIESFNRRESELAGKK